MPLLLELQPDGSVHGLVAVCERDRIAFAALMEDHGSGVIEHRERGSASGSDRLVEFTVSADTVSSGTITPDVPVTEFRAFDRQPVDLPDFGDLIIITTSFQVDADFEGDMFAHGSSVVAFGFLATDEEAYIRAVDRAEGAELIESWCAKQR